MLATCLDSNLEDMVIANETIPPAFLERWHSIYSIVSVAFLTRCNSMVIPRIPVILAVTRQLLFSLTLASDQRRKVDASQLKQLVRCAHLLDRLYDLM